jgi:2-dehydro-3-deoxygluconokinase
VICCFGEILLRYSPVADGGWIEQASMPVYVGGAELNVATALARWNVPVRYSTALPANALADDLLTYIGQRGIDPSGTFRPTPTLPLADRIGTYYLPQGRDLKNAAVIYDRAGSAFAALPPGRIDWEPVLAGISRLHLSAISPALSEPMARVCLELAEAATNRGIPVSIDLNYRARLWQYGTAPTAIMPALVQHCDVVMGNIWATNALLGIPVDPHIHDKGQPDAYVAHAEATAAELQVRYPRCRVVANTFRFGKQPSGIRYYTTLHTDGQTYLSPEYTTDAVVDQIGSGDCFMAGLLYGLHHHQAPQTTLDFATAAAFGKLHEIGDATKQTVAAIEATGATAANRPVPSANRETGS